MKWFKVATMGLRPGVMNRWEMGEHLVFIYYHKGKE